MPGVDILAQFGAGEQVSTDAGALLRAMQRARFDMMGVASMRAQAGDLAAGNAETKAALEASPALRGWVVLNAASPESCAQELRKHCGSARWLGGMLDPARFGHRLTSISSREVVNSYRRYTKPLLVMTRDAQTVADLDALAAEIPTLKFVAMGAGGDAWQDCMFAAKRNVNIFVEPFSGGAHAGKLETILGVVGPHRVLFGSNYPEHNPGAALGLLLEAKISDAEKQAVLTTNAARLFGLTRSAEA